MYEYREKIITELPSEMNRVSKTPPATHLFNLNNSEDKLVKDKAQPSSEATIFKL